MKYCSCGLRSLFRKSFKAGLAEKDNTYYNVRFISKKFFAASIHNMPLSQVILVSVEDYHTIGRCSNEYYLHTVPSCEISVNKLLLC